MPATSRLLLGELGLSAAFLLAPLEVFPHRLSGALPRIILDMLILNDPGVTCDGKVVEAELVFVEDLVHENEGACTVNHDWLFVAGAFTDSHSSAHDEVRFHDVELTAGDLIIVIK